MIVLRVFLLSLSLLLLTPPLSMGNSLPRSIGPLRLEQLQSGEEARQEIDRLHGKQISFLRGYIGTYKGEDGKAKLWLSEYDSAGKAAEATEKMAQGLKSGKQQPFWHFRELLIEGLPVYFVLGMGQAHYFYQKGAKVIWLAADPALANQTIRDVIGKIP